MGSRPPGPASQERRLKAELKPRINLEGRTPLETVISLSTPFVIFVDPASACNFKCTFCPPDIAT